jgi:hypothetical protein
MHDTSLRASFTHKANDSACKGISLNVQPLSSIAFCFETKHNKSCSVELSIAQCLFTKAHSNVMYGVRGIKSR